MNTVLDYHKRSKHHLDRYAPGPGGLDWASQPDPFRSFEGARQSELSLLEQELPVCWDALSAGARPRQPLTRTSVSYLLELSMGLSAWKSFGGNRWALRCNPSSGNLHPTEAYLICPAMSGLPAGVHHYRSDQHLLEQRAAAALDFAGGVLVALTGIHWREAWKYGMRAFRYCQHDCGHALAALSYAAACLGWRSRLLEAWSDDEIAHLTGTDRAIDFDNAEREAPEAIVWLGSGPPPDRAKVLAALATATWTGRANALSPAHVDWPDIPMVAAATRRNETSPVAPWQPPALPPLRATSSIPASALIRGRRSAQALDGHTAITASRFFRMLDALLPRPELAPWCLLDSAPELHVVLFVHRVTGLQPGIYVLPRTPAARDALRAAMRDDWLWAPVEGCPQHLPLALLAPLDVRDFARTVSCYQEIAADGAFSLAMLARFDDIDATSGWRYRQRFIEAGILGQVLYLEAEAAGVQGTGIGCYFDDAVHEALQLDTARFQDLYHFTVGKALIDTRLGNESGYAKLRASRLQAKG